MVTPSLGASLDLASPHLGQQNYCHTTAKYMPREELGSWGSRGQQASPRAGFFWCPCLTCLGQMRPVTSLQDCETTSVTKKEPRTVMESRESLRTEILGKGFETHSRCPGLLCQGLFFVGPRKVMDIARGMMWEREGKQEHSLNKDERPTERQVRVHPFFGL